MRSSIHVTLRFRILTSLSSPAPGPTIALILMSYHSDMSFAIHFKSSSRPKNVKSSPQTTSLKPRSWCTNVVGAALPRRSPTRPIFTA